MTPTPLPPEEIERLKTLLEKAEADPRNATSSFTRIDRPDTPCPHLMISIAYQNGGHGDLLMALVEAAPTMLAEIEAGRAEDEKSYQVGKDDGRSEAVQEIDRLTGGDGEYVYSTFPREGCPGPADMIKRIVERFEAGRAGSGRARDVPVKHLSTQGPFYARAMAWWAANNMKSEAKAAFVTGDGYIRYSWDDGEESGSYAIPIALLDGLSHEDGALRQAAQPSDGAQPASSVNDWRHGCCTHSTPYPFDHCPKCGVAPPAAPAQLGAQPAGLVEKCDCGCGGVAIALEVMKAAARSASYRDGVIAAANWLTADGSPRTSGDMVAALLPADAAPPASGAAAKTSTCRGGPNGSPIMGCEGGRKPVIGCRCKPGAGDEGEG